jgi:hypothetical protein
MTDAPATDTAPDLSALEAEAAAWARAAFEYFRKVEARQIAGEGLEALCGAPKPEGA